MEELSAVGEQVFDAECILSKRLRKVRISARPPPRRLQLCDRVLLLLLLCCRASWSFW